jgi:translocation and assembly module TamB
VTASKTRKEYRLDGTLEAERGVYTLKIGPVTRDFTVTRGTVRYLGTPDLNADLDIAAEYDVHTVTNQEIPVIARITGTILAPKLALESTQRPPIPEADLVSYLITGAPVAEANVLGQGRAVQSALAYLSTALASEVERAVVSDLGLPIDLLEIRPGVLEGPTGSSLTQVTAGWALGNKTFLTLNAGFCTQQNFDYQNIGASLERRFSRAWRAQVSIEPTYQSCLASNILSFSSTSPYQIGADVFWEREF